MRRITKAILGTAALGGAFFGGTYYAGNFGHRIELQSPFKLKDTASVSRDPEPSKQEVQPNTPRNLPATTSSQPVSPTSAPAESTSLSNSDENASQPEQIIREMTADSQQSIAEVYKRSAAVSQQMNKTHLDIVRGRRNPLNPGPSNRPIPGNAPNRETISPDNAPSSRQMNPIRPEILKGRQVPSTRRSNAPTDSSKK